MPHQITSISPNSGRNDVAMAISILGSGFTAVTSVKIGTIEVDNLTVVNTSYLTCDVPSLIIPGVYDVTIINGGESASLENSYRVMLPLPNPPFPDEIYGNIVIRMLSNSPGTWDKREGSFFRDLVNTMGLELAKLYLNMEALLQMTFIQYSMNGYMDLRAEEHGVVRNPAVKSTGTVTVTGTDTTIIPLGTLFSTTVTPNSGANAIQFETTVAAVISGNTDIAVQAVEGGSKGNISALNVNKIVTGINGLLTVSNADAITGGIDRESDDDFRIRFLQIVRNPVAGGNKQDYVTWALEVPGIGGAVSDPLWDGPGTVRVLIVDDDGDPADAGLITDVQNYISPNPGTGEGKAPIGATVTIAAPDAVSIDVIVTITVSFGADPDDTKILVANNLTAYIKSLPIGGDILYSAIANVIYDTIGVDDYSSYTLNGDVVNITVAITDKAVAGTLTVN